MLAACCLKSSTPFLARCRCCSIPTKISTAAAPAWFPTTAVSPWASFGGGFGHISQNGATLYGAANPGKGTTMAVLQYGIGLDVRIKRRLFVRGEGRDYWAGEPDFPLAPTG